MVNRTLALDLDLSNGFGRPFGPFLLDCCLIENKQKKNRSDLSSCSAANPYPIRNSCGC